MPIQKVLRFEILFRYTYKHESKSDAASLVAPALCEKYLNHDKHYINDRKVAEERTA